MNSNKKARFLRSLPRSFSVPSPVKSSSSAPRRPSPTTSPHHHLLPLPLDYFAGPVANANEQFFTFTSLAAWLMRELLGSDYRPPEQYSDPNETVTELMKKLAALGFAHPSQYVPQKLKAGWGQPVVAVLDGLTDMAMERAGVRLRPPAYPADDGRGEEDEAEDGDELGDPVDEDLAQASLAGWPFCVIGFVICGGLFLLAWRVTGVRWGSRMFFVER